MPRIRVLIMISLFTFCAVNHVNAQEMKPVPIGAAPAITVAASPDRLRFTSLNTVVQMHLQVYDNAGQSVFDVSSKGNVLDWTLQDSGGERLIPGSYLAVVTVKSLSGKLSQRIGSVALQDKQLELQPVNAAQLTAGQQQAVGPIEENGALTILKAGEPEASTVLAHDGNQGQITRSRGALSFRLGDFFSGNDTEQMLLTEKGNLGLGTDNPQAKLDVAGVIRTSKGLEFDNGTNVTKLTTTATGGLQQTLADGTVVPNATGTGTQNRIAKWTDNAGTLGDSLLNETGGGVELRSAAAGVGINPIFINPSTNAGFSLLQAYPATGPNTNLSFGVVPRGTGAANNRAQLALFNTDVIADPNNYEFASLRARGSDFVFGTGKSGTGQNRPIMFAAGFLSDNTSNNGQLYLATNGNTGIGTTVPTSVLHVVGTQPPAVSNGNGTNAIPALQVIGGNGGATNDLSVQSFGGTGASVITQAGNGGSANEGQGGDGGDVITKAGNSGGGHTGGIGGQIRLQAGAGQGFNGSGGGITLQAGAGAASVGAGGSIFLMAGANGPNSGGFGSIKLVPTGGNVNIGDFSNPDFKLQIFDSSNKGLRVQTNAAGGTVASFGGAGDFQVDASGLSAGRFVIKENGNVGIGKPIPSSLLHVDAPSSGNPISAMTIDVESFQTLGNAIASHFFRVHDVGSGPTSAFLIRGDGSVGIATDSPDHTLTVNGNADKPGGGSWDNFSDERLKTIKGRFTPGLKALMQLQPLRYEYKPDNALGLKSSGEHIGFGAQAVQKIIPEAVSKNNKGYLLVNNDPILWTMLNAIKEQQREIQNQRLKAEQQQQQLQEKHAHIGKLEARLATLETLVKNLSVRRRPRRR